MRRPVLLVLFIASLLLSYHINKPFIGHHDWNGVFWGSMARDYLRGNFHYFSHYTPFLPYLLSLSISFFGVHEWSLRLITVLFSLAMLTAIYRIGKLLYGNSVGLLAMVFAIVTPMFLYFGKLPDHEPIVTSLITIAFYRYLKLKNQNKNNQRLFLGVLTLALLESWSAYFLIPFLFIHAAVFEKKRLSTILVGLMIGIAIVVLHLSFINYFNGGEGLRNFLHAGTFRLNLDSSTTNLNRFTWPRFVETEARYAVIYFTRILLFLALVWFIRFFWSLRRKPQSSNTALLVLFFAGASFLLVFSNLAYIHDYKLYVLLPFLSLASAAVVISVFKVIRNMASGLVASALVVLIVTGIGVERLPYLRTLLATSYNAPGYQLGTLIHEKTKPEEKMLIDSTEFASFYEVFVTYYADRPITFADIRVTQFQKQEQEYQQFRYLVLVKSRPTEPALEQYLRETYESETNGDFTFFDLQKGKYNTSQEMFEKQLKVVRSFVELADAL